MAANIHPLHVSQKRKRKKSFLHNTFVRFSHLFFSFFFFSRRLLAHNPHTLDRRKGPTGGGGGVDEKNPRMDEKMGGERRRKALQIGCERDKRSTRKRSPSINILFPFWNRLSENVKIFSFFFLSLSPPRRQPPPQRTWFSRKCFYAIPSSEKRKKKPFHFLNSKLHYQLHFINPSDTFRVVHASVPPAGSDNPIQVRTTWEEKK